MEKLAREIVQAMKLLGMEPDEKNILQAAKKRRFAGNPAELVKRARKLWKTDYFQSFLRHYQKANKNRNATMALEEHCEELAGRLWDGNASRFKASRGLVVGDVQSGKTGNFIGLMAQAADLGVPLFIVLAGVSNLLRGQTQKRIDEGFVGLSLEDDGKSGALEHVGVGMDRDFSVAHCYTSMESDHVAAAAAHPALLNRPGVIVVKKCQDALKNLLRWLERQPEIHAKGNLPMLMIDDEADLASLNRNGEEEDQRAVHKLILNILDHFQNSAYLGYTATPFDNLRSQDGLTPRDIVCCLPEPGRNYFGPEKLFLNNKIRERALKTIEGGEWHQTRSLNKAFRTFLVARALYARKIDPDKGCSMLVNICHENEPQERIRDNLRNYWHGLRRGLLKGHGWEEMREIYEEEFSEAYPKAWKAARGYLNRLLNMDVNFYLVNSKGDDQDKVAAALEANGSTSVLIGGYALARGVSIPRLLVSYVKRDSANEATLMQLGRWFGYRGKYLRLCRVWMTERMQEAFTLAADNLARLKDAINDLDPERPYWEQKNTVLGVLGEADEEEE